MTRGENRHQTLFKAFKKPNCFTILATKIEETQFEQVSDQSVTQQLKRHQEDLSKYARQVVHSLLKQMNHIPVCLRVVCKMIDQIVRARFPGVEDQQVYRAVGKFFFSCYLLPLFRYDAIQLERPAASGTRKETSKAP